MFNNLTIKFRLTAVLAILSLIMLALGIAGILSVGHTNDTLRLVYEERVVSLGQLDGVIRAMNRNQLAVARAVTDDPAQLPATIAVLEKNRALANSEWDQYAAEFLTLEEKQLADRFRQARDIFNAEGLDPVLAAARSGDTERIRTLMNTKLDPAFTAARDILNSLIEMQLREAKASFDLSQERYRAFRLLAVAALAGGLLLAAGIGWWLVRSITAPLDYAVRIAEGVAAGDLTQQIEVHSNDETGHLLGALRGMNASLATIVGNVRGATDTIATASEQIASGNMDLSRRTEEQAGSLEETASSMEELTGTVRQNADNARQASKLAHAASDVAVRGGSVVTQVVAKMGAINDSSRKIVEIISVIDGIAFQTNILALNAAVEAARAGEQGRGFAVVASEVRNLAQRSASAAKEIKELIGGSVEQVDAGSALVEQAGATMGEVVDAVRRVSDIINEITSASVEQSTGIEQVNQAVIQMDAVTQQNASLVEEAAAAATSMREQAAALSQAVSVFQLAGHDAPARTAAVTRLQPRAARLAAPDAGSGAGRQAQPLQAANGDWEEF